MGEEGFSFIELIIAVTMIAGELVSLTKAAGGGLTSVQETRSGSAFLEVASSEVEDLRALPYDQLGVRSDDPDRAAAYPNGLHQGRPAVMVPAPGAPASVTNITADQDKQAPLAHTIRRWVTWSGLDPADPQGMKRVDVVVEWVEPSGRARSVTLDSLVYASAGTAPATQRVPTPRVVATPTSGTAPQAVAFDASSSTPGAGGAIASYQWQFGDGTTAGSSIPTISHTYVAAGTYSAVLTVADAGGFTASTSVTITVVAPAPVNLPPTARLAVTPTSGTGPLLVNGNGSASTDPEGGALTYRWTWGDGTTSTGVAPSHTYGNPGTFTIVLTVTDPAGATGSASQAVTVTAATCQIISGSFLNPSTGTTKNDITVKNNNKANNTSFSFTAQTNALCASLSVALPTSGTTWVVTLRQSAATTTTRTWTATANSTDTFVRASAQSWWVYVPTATTTNLTLSFSVHT